ncbi:hypothetical protein Tco_0174828, partial [Tanacetum coccineum]
MGSDFKHKSAWLFLKYKHKWKNPDSTNARRNRHRVTDEEPELFGPDELPRPPDKETIAKSQRSSNSTVASGSNQAMFQEMMQQQLELNQKEFNGAYRLRWNWKIQEIPDIIVLLNDRLTVHPTQKKVGAKLNLREVRRSSQRTKRRLDFKDGEATTKEVIWKAMEMEHYLEYIDNDVWKKGRLRISCCMRRFHGMDDAKEIWEAIRTSSEGLEKGYMIDSNNYFTQWKPCAEAKGTHDGKKKRDSFYQHQEAGKQEKNQMGLLTMDDGIVNWGEHTEVEETNHALMAISSSNEVTLCSKTCIDSYNTLKLLCDEQMNQLGDQEAQILAYSQAVKKLEAQLVTFQKQQLSLNEKLTFQANEIYEKDEKLKRYRRIGMKAVKEKEQLQKTLDSWKDSSKNLWRLINSGMSSNKDSVGKPLYSRFTKTNDFKGVPHPLSRDYTPTPQEEIDESLYVYGKKGPQEPEPNVSDDRSSEYSTCQSNDSAGSIGTSSEHSVDSESEISSVPPEVYVSTPITTNEKGVSDPKSKEVEPSCVSHIKTPRQPIKDQATPKVNRKNWNAMMERELGEGYSFTKKKCFVCGSLSHLIKDCDYYEKKMAREAEFKKQRVFNTGNGVAKPVWTNANRVNHANKLVPRPRINVNPVRPRVNTGSSNVNTVRSRQPVPNKTSNSFSPKRPQVNQFNQRGHFSKSYSSVRRPFAKTTAQMSHSHAVKGNWRSAFKTSTGYNWRNTKPNSNCDSGPTFIRTVNDHPLKNMVDRGIFDSGCSGHMT